MRRPLSNAETLIQCGDFYPVWGHLFSAKAFIQCGDFYPVWGLLSSMGTFIQYGETFIVCGDSYPVWALFSLTKQRKTANTATTILDFKNYICN